MNVGLSLCQKSITDSRINQGRLMGNNIYHIFFLENTTIYDK